MQTTLTHWTHKDNAASILARGLLTEYATGRRKACWVCSAAHAEWARDHVAARHNWNVEDVVCIAVRVVTGRTMKHSRPGVFFTYRDIPPQDILCVYNLAANPEV